MRTWFLSGIAATRWTNQTAADHGKVRGKTVTLVNDIVAVKRETQHKVVLRETQHKVMFKREPVAPWNPSKRLRKSGPPLAPSEDKRCKHTAAKAVVDLS